MMANEMKIAILGVGGLGSALARGLVREVRAGRASLALSDRNADKLAPFAQDAKLFADPVEAAKDADVALLCVKPKGTAALAAQLTLAPDALLVSCAAGVAVSSLAGAFAGGVARAMPSIGAAAGASTTAVFLGPRCVPDRDGPR